MTVIVPTIFAYFGSKQGDLVRKLDLGCNKMGLTFVSWRHLRSLRRDGMTNVSWEIRRSMLKVSCPTDLPVIEGVYWKLSDEERGSRAMRMSSFPPVHVVTLCYEGELRFRGGGVSA